MTVGWISSTIRTARIRRAGGRHSCAPRPARAAADCRVSVERRECLHDPILSSGFPQMNLQCECASQTASGAGDVRRRKHLALRPSARRAKRWELRLSPAFNKSESYKEAVDRLLQPDGRITLVGCELVDGDGEAINLDRFARLAASTLVRIRSSSSGAKSPGPKGFPHQLEMNFTKCRVKSVKPDFDLTSKNTQCDVGLCFHDCEFITQPSFAGAKLCRLHLIRCKLPGIYCSDADCQFLSLKGSVVTGPVSLEKASVRHANFDEARFEGDVNLRDAEFTTASFRRTRFCGECDLIGARINPRDALSDVEVTTLKRKSLWWPRVWARFSWSVVRSVGEITMLTRASYWALIAVPLVAGVWPNTPPFDRFDFSLPLIWPVAYFAALCVAIGHLVYQISSPRLVKEMDLDDYVRSEIDDRVRALDNQRDDALQRAFNALGEAATQLPALRHPSFVTRHQAAMWIPRNRLEFNQYDKWKETNFGGPDVREISLVLVEEGARATYTVQARQHMLPAVIAMLMYCFAAILVAWIVVLQSLAVLRAMR